MIPNFALSLSFDGIGLLRRTGPRWSLIAEVAIDDPDMDTAVAGLRDRATTLDPRGSQVLLVIPNEQIRYLDLPDLGGDDSARAAAIAAALDGATPYPVSDLTHDHTVSGGRLLIAAVANETLAEAEGFAETHGFTPVGFAAIAPKGAFDGAVFFGRAASWRRSADRPPRAIEIVPANEAALTPVAAAPKPPAVAAPAQASKPDTPPSHKTPAQPPETAPAPKAAADAGAAVAPNAKSVDASPAAASAAAPLALSSGAETAEPSPAVPAAKANRPTFSKTDKAKTTIPSEAENGKTTATEAKADTAAAAKAKKAEAMKATATPTDTIADAAKAQKVSPGKTKAAAPPTAMTATAEATDTTADETVPAKPQPAAPNPTTPKADSAPAFEATPERRAGGKAAEPADLAPLPEISPSDTAEPQGSFAFTSVRAKRDEAIPPAPRPLKLGADSGATQRPRFTPVTAPKGSSTTRAKAAEEARTGGAAPKAAPHRADPPVSRPKPPDAAPSDAGRPVPTAAGPGPKKATPPLAKPAPASGARVPPLTNAADGRDAGTSPVAKAPETTVARAKPSPEADAPPPSGSRSSAEWAAHTAPAIPGDAKPRPAIASPAAKASGAVPPASLDRDAARDDGTPAPAPVAARSMAEAPGPNPLARLAALRSQGRSAPAAPPAATTAPALGRAAAAAAAIPADGHARFASPKEAGRTLTSSSDERERMTVFGARNNDQIGGKPRFLGLMLTAALLIFLAGVAAWASVFLDEGLARLFRSPEPETQIATQPAEIDPEPESATPPDTPPQAEAAEEVQLAALDPEPKPEETPAPQREAAFDVTPAPEPATPALSRPLKPTALSPEEAAATYAATGIWQRAPAPPLTPPDEGVEDIYVASIDPSVESSDAVALPVALSPTDEPVLQEPGLPPPAGMTFDIDERGLVRATPEGALTPEGLRIYAGLPPAVPPLRSPPEAEPETEDATPDAPPVVDRLERFRDLRPQARPDDVIEQRERATLQGISRNELADMRPVARPVSVQEEAEAAEPESPSTAQAVLASPAPVQRPGNFAAVVQRAERAPQPEAAPVQTAAVAPRTVSPAVPSSASVARSATVRNAINLGRINLIGVYGTPNNRRALVRLASGKYQKVKVGDRLDGGRVSAIGDSELRYTKGSRNITLDMPSG